MPRSLLNPVARRVLLAALAIAPLMSESTAAEYTLERVVLVSRHGVRAPTDSEKLNDYTLSKKWPGWPVADACLTPRGKMLATLMGSFYRDEFTNRRLFPDGQQPAADQVFVLADIDQRTKQTGEGLLGGILARTPRELPPDVFCPPKKKTAAAKGNRKQDDEESDPLFHPVKAGVCKFQKDEARNAVLDRVPDRDLSKGWAPYSAGVQQLQDALDCCQPKPVCNKGSGTCTLQSASSDVKATGTSVSLSGPIAIGSTVSEVFLLEYAQAMEKVAWGTVTAAAQIDPMLKLHDLQFDLIQRTRYIADRQGSALMHQVLETLRQTAERKSEARRKVPAKAKLVIYVGHDTNLANLGGMLGVDWQFKSGLGDKTPPAGAMAFELLRQREAPRGYYVRMTYYSQTLDQMREATKLTTDPNLRSTPEIVSIALPVGTSGLCAKTQDGGCPWQEFYGQVSKNLIMKACVPKKS